MPKTIEGPTIKFGGNVKANRVQQIGKMEISEGQVKVDRDVAVGGDDFDPESPPQTLPLDKVGDTLTIKGVAYNWNEEKGHYTLAEQEEKQG